jgi:DnaK suppressor protein
MALTAQQTEELKGMIDQRRNALVAEIRRDMAKARAEPFGELAGAAPDAGDESVATLIQDLDQFDVSRDVAELRGLDAAGDRIKSGQYGICADCGSEIEYARLRANPGASRCITCQQTYEKTHAGAGGPTL